MAHSTQKCGKFENKLLWSFHPKYRQPNLQGAKVVDIYKTPFSENYLKYKPIDVFQTERFQIILEILIKEKWWRVVLEL